ncbi:MAG: methionine--tRNA ligase subunit beta [Candidatus Colwellbacteria bacterium RIFCSPHIGHO2_12_FULL_44_17]|uniref:Methionine--tRNA ligase n=2 Tax=Candidatus Colwelliibacteriota TaxID=1817904 RepID=A0A1G1Z5L8_9BACT|nr:MAG: methionine--tRNA ligase subunit beta [Candidatus Colwellbacteria bacterium RIFCSPHIGHO2_12_FULL_44_17]OGY59326.1 MAG: methionine--tRNA ligase subunit beta [Candidatus Colwellbacteria bacterium RIFCSPLOWO2_02_FULL_44_20b]
MINYETFQNIELRIAKVLEAERVEGSDKLLKLYIDLGEEKRQLVAGVGKVYDPVLLVGREIVIVANLEPRMLMGLESQGMLLAADSEAGPVLLQPDKEVLPGSKVK